MSNRVCPRCGHKEIRRITQSPVGEVWEVYACRKCGYSWRSTEEIHILDKFRLDDEKIANMQVIPPVPPLAKRG